MQDEVLEVRIMEEANFIADTGATVRSAAEVFHISKSTVHTVVII